MISLSSPLDRETHSSFSLTVSATDQGTPRLSTTVSHTHSESIPLTYPSLPHMLQVMVTINVTDVNDNHPIFNIPTGGYVASLPEDSPPGSEVITVVATDRDSGLHSQITYSLADNSVPFQIQDPAVCVYVISESVGMCVCAGWSHNDLVITGPRD